MKYWLYAMMVFSLGWQNHAFASCEQAQALYQSARVNKDIQLNQVNAALTTCDKHIGLYVLQGDLYSAQGNFPQAITSYEKALSIQRAMNIRQHQMDILLRLLNSQLLNNNRFEASYVMQKIHQYKQNGLPLSSQQEQLLKAADESLNQNLVQHPLQENELKNLLANSTRDLVLEPPTLNYRLHFEVNATLPNAQSQMQLQQISQAMLVPEVKTIEIIGHTDRNGTLEYNQQLSLKRAQAVKQLLSQHQPSIAHKLVALGKGKTEILYQGQTEEDHRLNRRVEFVFKTSVQ